MNEEMKRNTIMAEFGRLWFTEMNMLHVEFNSNSELSGKQVSQLLLIVGKLDQENPKPLIIDLRGISRINLNSIRAFISVQAGNCKRQSAVLVKSVTTRMILNMLGYLVKTPLKLRSFTREDQAVNWACKPAA